MPDGVLDLHKGVKGAGNGSHATKCKRLFTRNIFF